MEIDTLLEALKDFEKKAKKELSPVLEQFLCHVAKTGETLVPWSQFKSYFIFKLEKVMDDFKATAPELRGPSNPNVECVPFEEMKARILKIVNGYTGIPFTIQRLCELLTEPKRNYTGTEKFLRGVEKNVMVVSCVHPTSEKNGCSGVNRMNGVMLPGNTSAFAERKVNGPGTPRPLNRQKVSLASSLATNGLPDSTENKDPNAGSGHVKTHSETSPSGPSRVLTRSKHSVKDDEEEESLEEEEPEVKRLKFLKDGKEGAEEEDDEEEEEEEDEEEEAEVDAPVDTPRPVVAPESSSDAKQALAQSSGSPEKQRDEELDEDEEDSGPASSTAACQDQEPSSTQSEPCAEDSKATEKEVEREADSEESELPSGSDDSPSEPTDMDQSEQSAPSGTTASPESREAGDESNEHVSSSSSSTSSSSSSSCSEESEESNPAATPSDSTTEPPTEGAPESAAQDSASAEEPMEVD